MPKTRSIQPRLPEPQRLAAIMAIGLCAAVIPSAVAQDGGANRQAARSDSTALPAQEREPGSALAQNAKRGERPSPAAVLQLHGEINDVMVDSLKRRIATAKERDAKTIIFDMDTPGGLVTSSIAIADLIRHLDDIHTVAWVNPNAHSGGAIVAVSADEIVMSRSSRIGDAQVIMFGPGGADAVPEDIEAKAITPVLADLRASAKLNGYSQTMCEAFVIPDREVWWIEHKETGERKFVFRAEKLHLVGADEGEIPSVFSKPEKKKPDTESEDDSGKNAPKGADTDTQSDESRAADEKQWTLVKTYYDVIVGTELDVIQPVVRSDQLLEMSAAEAYAYGFSKGVISDRDALSEYVAASDVSYLAPNWSESLAYWLTSMYVRGFLLVLIFLAAYVEFHTPGVGVAGLTALVALAIFVAAPYMTGLATTWEILIIGLGIVLIGVELFVIPGFGVAGISGLVLVLLGLLATFVPTEPGQPLPISLPSLPATQEYLRRGMITIMTSIIMSVIGMFVLGKYLPKTTIFARLAPANPTPSEVAIDDAYRGAAMVGDTGKATTPLRPSGKALFGDVLVDVVTRGELVDAGSSVQVIERRGNQVKVRAV